MKESCDAERVPVSKTEDCLEQEVNRETAVHGAGWGAQYGGYFGDPAVVEPFVKVITHAVEEQMPDVVVDIGGGTGFLLGQLLESNVFSERTRLVDMDLSEKQLAEISNRRIQPLQGSFMEFLREQVASPDERLMILTRSTLHYAGVLGQKPTLRHIRNQLSPGEYFLHQTITTSNAIEALLADEIMERIHTEKWFPPIHEMIQMCRDSGFDVTNVSDAPSLTIRDSDLVARYHVSQKEMWSIQQKLVSEYADDDVPIWQPSDDGFVLLAPYKIITCRAC